MAGINSADGKKWINAFVAIMSIIVGFVVIRFLEQMGEWFDLEARVNNFMVVSQALGVIVGLGTFIAIFKNKVASSHLDEVYGELTKVIWPQRDNVIKVTVGILIGLVIVSGIFVAFDFIFKNLLDLLY